MTSKIRVFIKLGYDIFELNDNIRVDCKLVKVIEVVANLTQRLLLNKRLFVVAK